MRCYLPRQIHAHESTDRLPVVQRILDPFARQAEALLRHLHARQTDRPTPAPFGQCGSISASSSAHGFTASIWKTNRSRRAIFFLAAYSRSEKLDCIGVVRHEGSTSILLNCGSTAGYIKNNLISITTFTQEQVALSSSIRGFKKLRFLFQECFFRKCCRTVPDDNPHREVHMFESLNRISWYRFCQPLIACQSISNDGSH